MKLKKIALIICIIISSVFSGSIIAGLSVSFLPAPEILGVNDILYKLGNKYPNLLEGVTAFDCNKNDLSDKIVVDDSKVDKIRKGVYDISYSVTDRHNKTTIVYAKLIITTSSPYFVGLIDIYCLKGFEINYFKNIHAYDSNDCNIDTLIMVDYSDVDINKVGVYTVLYSVEDNFGALAKAEIKLHIVDTFNPIFKGISPCQFIIGVDEKVNYLNSVSAFSYKGIDITKFINVDDTFVDLHNEDEYIVYYSVTDSEGNSSNETSCVIVVNADSYYPTINGIADYELSLGGLLPNWHENITAFDNVDNDITDKINIDSSQVNINQIGEYFVKYSVENSRGFEFVAYAKVVVSVVNPDITSPEISGHKDLEFIYGKTNEIDYLDGVTAYDDVDGDITNKVEVDNSNVDLTKVGIYTLQYFVKDNAGNEARVQVNISIIDGTPPVFYNLVSFEHYIGKPIPNLISGITARDDVDGDITNKIKVDDKSVDWQIPGEYLVKYSVVDSADNWAFAEVKVTVLS